MGRDLRQCCGKDRGTKGKYPIGTVAVFEQPCTDVAGVNLDSILDSSPQQKLVICSDPGDEIIALLLANLPVAGYLDAPGWDISLIKGKHDGLVPFDIWKKVQEHLMAKPDLPVRRDSRPEFPLRGYVSCDCCGRPMTAAMSKGRNAYYPYYECQTKSCTDYRKGVRAEKMTDEFEALLKSMEPAPSLFAMVVDMLRDLWRHRELHMESRQAAAREELATIERKVGQLIDRLADADSETLVRAYEKQVRALEERRIVLVESLVQKQAPRHTFDETSNRVHVPRKPLQTMEF